MAGSPSDRRYSLNWVGEARWFSAGNGIVRAAVAWPELERLANGARTTGGRQFRLTLNS
jgi:hypothetical protein